MSVQWLYFVLFVVSTCGGYAQEGAFEQDDRYCVCVPYWQCKEDFSGLIEEDTDTLDALEGVDVRMAEENSGDSTSACKNDLDVCCPLECGKRMSITSEVLVNRKFVDEVYGFRILGDIEAEFAEFPWMLGILEDRTYRCGASLIHPQVAMTAAHCVTGNGQFVIRAGEWNWESKEELLPHQERKAKKIVKHPNFHAPSLRNDIALIILNEPFHLTQNVGIICLPQQGTMFDHANCVAAGWGKNSYRKGTYQSTLKKVNLPVVSRDKCLQALRDAVLGPSFNLHQSFICAGGEADKDTCKGDGGSPLMCPVSGRLGKYQQAGIVSWGLTCGKHDTPGVYVNLGMFRDWIDFTMTVHGFEAAAKKYRNRLWF
ncbi:hypothetical protein JTB14_016888 [Gonioctena quinquepunctata]|nr:hypothetical protein JTB14_016888 [Gonioctena quinquepunctata]